MVESNKEMQKPRPLDGVFLNHMGADLFDGIHQKIAGPDLRDGGAAGLAPGLHPHGRTGAGYEQVNVEDLQQMLINMSILRDIQILEGEGISETEKNRFNSKFEIIEGENLDTENMLRIFEVIKDNIANSQTVSNKELKIEISREDKNEDLVKALEEFIRNDEKRKYNTKVEYDEETGLVKYVTLTIVDEKK